MARLPQHFYTSRLPSQIHLYSHRIQLSHEQIPPVPIRYPRPAWHLQLACKAPPSGKAQQHHPRIAPASELSDRPRLQLPKLPWHVPLKRPIQEGADSDPEVLRAVPAVANRPMLAARALCSISRQTGRLPAPPEQRKSTSSISGMYFDSLFRANTVATIKPSGSLRRDAR